MGLINFLKMFWGNFRGQYEKYPITSYELDKILKKMKLDYYEMTDMTYKTCNYKSAKRLAKLIPVRHRKYKTEENDCDDFARQFWALTKVGFPLFPVAYVHVKTKSGLHATNIIFFRTKSGRLDWSFVEPQTGNMSMFEWKPYLVLI